MTSLTTSDDGSMYEQLEELSHQYTARIRRGEKPDIEEYTNANPELAESIRELFEAILFAEQLNCRTEIAQPAAETFPMQLGPFVLQREIGRGGMGIVYEATQSPFTQTFAVKVLKSRLISSRTLESGSSGRRRRRRSYTTPILFPQSTTAPKEIRTFWSCR